jgi:hypothetical protein
VKDKIGKVFVYQGEGVSRCLVCDVLMSRTESRKHSTEVCFPAPPACPPIPQGVTAGAA